MKFVTYSLVSAANTQINGLSLVFFYIKLVMYIKTRF